jgi:hypothetical protein
MAQARAASSIKGMSEPRQQAHDAPTREKARREPVGNRSPTRQRRLVFPKRMNATSRAGVIPRTEATPTSQSGVSPNSRRPSNTPSRCGIRSAYGSTALDVALPLRRVYARATNQVPPRRVNVRGRDPGGMNSMSVHKPSVGGA